MCEISACTPGDTALHEAEALHRARQRRDARQDRGAGRSLECEQAVALAAVFDAGLAARVPHDPAVVLLDVRGVHAQEQRVVGEAVDGDVVHHAAVFVAEQAVAHAAGLQRRDRAADEPLDARHRARPREMDLAHVRDVEEARGVAHRGVFLEDRRVLHRHVEAGERHDARTERAVGFVERRAPVCAHRALATPVRVRYASSVLRSSIVIVIGPTPPRDGVSRPATPERRVEVDVAHLLAVHHVHADVDHRGAGADPVAA